jgi:hypothetical protein
VARENLARKPRGVEGVVEASEEHHGQQQHHPRVGKHLQHTQHFFAQRPLLNVYFRAVPAGAESNRKLCCLGGGEENAGVFERHRNTL